MRNGKKVDIAVPDCGGMVQFVSFTFLIVIILAVMSAHGEIYYVAPVGSDANPGTESQPWLTIQYAAETLVAGDMVYIKAGTYREHIELQNSGSPGHYIVYTAYPGDVVTIDGGGFDLPDWESGLFTVEDVSYIRISGLRIINAGPYDNNAGIYVDNTHHIIIENNTTYNTTSSGIGVWSSHNILIDGNEVELACNDGEQECITVAVTDAFEVRNNHIHHGGPGTNGGEGIDAKDGSSNGIVHGNYIHHIKSERTGIYLESWDKHTYNIEVYQNIIHDCGAGISLASEMGGLLENANIYNNIAYGNRSNGLEIGNWGEPGVSKHPIDYVTFINNTVYGNGSADWGGGIYIENPDCKHIVVRNNIFSQNVLFQIGHEIDLAGQDVIIDHNLIDGFRGELDEEIYGSDYVEGDPKFMDISGSDFHLQENSPAIDNGSSVDAPGEDFDGNPRPEGGEYDMGAYEYRDQTGVPQETRKNRIPEKFRLSQNYPNPFNPETTIRFHVKESCRVMLRVYDCLGREVASLIDNHYYPGIYQLEFNSIGLASGIYIYKIRMGDFQAEKSMVVME